MSPHALTPEQIRARIVITDIVWHGTPCWRWSGQHRKSDGRPVLNRRYVYRVVYEIERGPLPQGKGNAGHHGCEHKWCINPWHLISITQTKHMQAHGFGGDQCQARKTHCPAGHAYDEINTYFYQRKDGRIERHCRACATNNMRRWRHEHESRSAQ